MTGPLTGLKILDLTTVLMGPYATQILGDMGADVVKIESPEGDSVRGIGPFRNPGMGSIFLQANRGKRSIVLDLKQQQGREALLKLVETADVLVYNLRPQVMERLRLGYADVAASNPKIIYAGLFGYGQDGPYAARPAYDDLMQGGTGIPSLVQRAGNPAPRYAPLAIADRVVGIWAVGAITAALWHRERHGEGQRIDIPMFETMAQLVLGDHMGGGLFEPALGDMGYGRLLSHDRRPYPTKDGYVCALVYSDKQWRRFFEAIGETARFSPAIPALRHHHQPLQAYRRNLRDGDDLHDAADDRGMGRASFRDRHSGRTAAHHRAARRRSASAGQGLLPDATASHRGLAAHAGRADTVFEIAGRHRRPGAAARRA